MRTSRNRKLILVQALLSLVKEELEALRKQYEPSSLRPYADPDVFSDELGRLAGKVCQAALLNPKVKFKVRELAAAVFIKTVNLLNPRILSVIPILQRKF